jgi:GNAT superfamily N-acetyltransferase
MKMELVRGEFELSTDKDRLVIDAIQEYLVEDSYWARERTLEQTKAAIEHSICFGVYHGVEQIGFGRVVSDRATFAYIGDIYILPEYRGRGLSKWLMEAMVGHPELQGLRRWVLATRDAHTLYEKFGFHELVHPDRWMERPAPNAY